MLHARQTIDVVQPTYIMKPEETEKFYPSQAKKIAEDVLNWEMRESSSEDVAENGTIGGSSRINEKLMEDWIDFGDDVESIAKDLSDKIRKRCKKELNLPRYKLVVQVTLGQRNNQGVQISSRCLWDTATDNYAAASYQNKFVWISALVFALYTE